MKVMNIRKTLKTMCAVIADNFYKLTTETITGRRKNRITFNRNCKHKITPYYILYNY